ncbi:glycosyltransferase family 2 protein [Christiangramia echinicola]|uniref:glycosyltransferase family 2 protein n=1 Tax=Christiangramia echinicola TaxID=279359 RepID=UPI000401971F|nr:glycosyltransferase family 2 protein [Christiangramia echinicola]
MNDPKISIITPSYNQGEYLEDTINSVLGQSYPNLEYMIFDGGSEDESVNVIKKYQDKITYWESKKDKGQSHAINKGFSQCTGEILMWLNSDDILLPNILHFIAQQYLKKGDGIFFGNCIQFKELMPHGIVAHGSNVIAKEKNIPLELADTIIQPSSFWSKKVWNENKDLNENFHYGFDWEWFLRAKKNGIPFYSFNKPISLYRIHDNHKTGVGGKERQQELLEIYLLYSPFYAKLYKLMMKEDFTFSFFEKILFRLYQLYSKSELSKTHFLKIIRKKEYEPYSVREINIIRSML